MSAIGWEMAARLMPIIGLGTEAAMAPPISACAVAVIKSPNYSIHCFVNLIQSEDYGSVSAMLPVLFSIGTIPVSSFGIFLALGFLLGVFLVWRLSRAWELDEERVLDLTLLTFLGGLIGARLYFVLENLALFLPNIFNILLIQKVSGLSFWGAILGGWLTLYFFTYKRKEDFWQITDIAVVGFIGGLILADLGCFLSGCEVGIHSNFLAVDMVGFMGKRFAVQIFEALLLLLVLRKIWGSALHFHPHGKILSLSLIYLGLIKLILEPLKENRSEGIFLSAVLFFLGVVILYKVTKRKFSVDIRNVALLIPRLITEKQSRKSVLDRLKKSWYNQMTAITWKLRNLKKTLRRLNVRIS